MPVKQFTVSTHDRTELINIDDQVQRMVNESGVRTGICQVFIPHTTAAVTINENADPDVVRDILKEIDKVIPFDDGYRHGEGNSAAHIKSSLVGCDQTVPIEEGRLVLGTWQSIFFCEFDGPRQRKVIVQIIGSSA